ncbi:MAG: alpha/beta hydrolase [Phycisphaerae bacterium]|jgi:hypothetical protein
MLITPVLLLLIAYIGLGAVLFFMQPSFTFQPTKDLLYNPGDIGLEYEKVQLKTPDGLILSAWFIPAEKAEFTVLLCDGNGGNMSHRLDLIKILNEIGLNCLIFDYRGYGASGGRPTEQGVYIDARTAYDWLINEKKIEPEEVIMFGQSLGGSIAAHLASNVKVQGLIIESGFTSYTDIGRKFYPYMPVKLFARYGFKTSEYLQKVNCPVLIIHSRNDEIIPFEFGRRLYEEAAKEPKEFLEITGGHNDGFLQSGQIYRQGLSNWIQFVNKYRQQNAVKIKIVS